MGAMEGLLRFAVTRATATQTFLQLGRVLLKSQNSQAPSYLYASTLALPLPMILGETFVPDIGLPTPAVLAKVGPSRCTVRCSSEPTHAHGRHQCRNVPDGLVAAFRGVPLWRSPLYLSDSGPALTSPLLVTGLIWAHPKSF